MTTKLIVAIKRRSGSLALETLVMMMGWLVAVFMMFNVVLVTSNRIVLQGLLNRITIQASAQGCVDQDIIDQLHRMPTFGASDINLIANTPPTNSPDFDLASVQGPTAPSALCSQTPQPLASGRYMYLNLSYTQRMFILPQVTVSLGSLGVSHTLTFDK
jgi:hypothetical protein